MALCAVLAGAIRASAVVPVASAPTKQPAPPAPGAPISDVSPSQATAALTGPLGGIGGGTLVPADSPEVHKLEARQRELDEMNAEAKEFEVEAKEYRRDAAELIRRKLAEKKDELKQYYDKQIKAVEEIERQNRLDAIAVFERFIQLYPDEPRYTPDAMARLAELYYEKTADQQQLAMAAYEERVKLGSEEAAPDQKSNFTRSIALYDKIIGKFPKYRLLDSIYYLLGWCQNAQGDEEKARDTFLALTEKFPKSHYVPEAWVRIGEYWFDFEPKNPKDLKAVDDALAKAIVAYKNAAQYRDSAFFDKALYKLGWSYFRINDYDDAVDSFVRLVDYYDDMKKAGKDTGAELRAEALQYTAVSFADDNWGKTHSLADFFRTRGPRAYEYELFKKLGDIFFDETRYLDAINAYREVITRNPSAPDAPQTQERIVQSFARLQDRESAFRERSVLIATYQPGSAWSKANSDDSDALQAASDLIEKSALLSAQYYHEQAEEYAKEANKPDVAPDIRDQKRALALQAYRNAAIAYEGYVKQFPNSKNLYDIQYLYAETLYNSLQFKPAADAFAKVRDSHADNKYLINAAYYVVLSLQREIDQEEQVGLLEKREPCTVDTCKGLTDFTAKPIPDVRLKLISAADIYLQRVPTAEDAAILSYTAAQTYFRYFHFDEAHDRYEDVIRRYPTTRAAQYAYEDELVGSMLAKNWKETERIADRMLQLKSVQADPKQFAQKRLVKYGARFEEAADLMSKKDWEGCAKMYLSIVDDTEAESAKWGKWDQADKALFNAATCYKAEYKFDSAMRTYEQLFTGYPKSDLAEQALFFVAENAEKAFEFDKAIDRYKQLVETFPKSKDAQAAQYNAARRLEALQHYSEAADAYFRYAQMFPDQPDAPDMAYQGVLMYQRMKDTPQLIQGLQRFIEKFGGRSDTHERVVEAELRLGNAYAEQDDQDEADHAYRQAVEDFDQFHLTTNDYTGAQAASEAAFKLAEKDLEKFQAERFDPRGRGKALTRSMTDQLQNLAQGLEDIRKTYEDVIAHYHWPEWSTAALYRIGFSYDSFAQKIMQSPCPHEIRILGEDACDQYNAALSDKMSTILEKAADAYQLAVDKARDLRVVNDWTKLAMEKVCQNTPSKCGSMKAPREELMFDSLSPLPPKADALGTRSVAYEPVKKAPPPSEPPPPVPVPAPAGIGAPPAPTGTTPAPAPVGGATPPPVTAPGGMVITLPPGSGGAP